MPSQAIHGVGALFKRGDGTSSEEFIAIAEVNTITGPEITAGTIDVTSLDSTGGYREFIAGFIDGGEVSIDMNFRLDGYDDLKADIEGRELHNYQVVFPDTNQTTFEFAAIMTRLGVAVPTEDKITATATFKISGQITLTS
jgi:predicted secreted protein